MPKPHLVIVILGPTAVGKTAVAIKLAKHFNTEIISADSRQFYKQLQIGTATPSASELNQAPHHFIGNLNIEDSYNVSKYETEALACANSLFKNHQQIILIGGSGLYIDAFCKGIDVLPDPNPELRASLKDKFMHDGIESLQNELKILDPECYALIDFANPNRVMRALEIRIQTGIPNAQLKIQNYTPRPFQICKIGLNLCREELYHRINQRVDSMMEAGLLKEVTSLFPFRHLNSLNTVGYKELFSHLEGSISLEEAVEKIKIHSRRYAKRQLTWFQRDKEIHWFCPRDWDEIIAYVNQER